MLGEKEEEPYPVKAEVLESRVVIVSPVTGISVVAVDDEDGIDDVEADGAMVAVDMDEEAELEVDDGETASGELGEAAGGDEAAVVEVVDLPAFDLDMPSEENLIECVSVYDSLSLARLA